MGMKEGFFGVLNFRFWDFLGRIIRQDLPNYSTQLFYPISEWLDLSRDFWGISNDLKIHSSARISRPHGFANKVQPNLFCLLEIFNARKFSMGLFWVLIFHLLHLKSGVSIGIKPQQTQKIIIPWLNTYNQTTPLGINILWTQVHWENNRHLQDKWLKKGIKVCGLQTWKCNNIVITV